LGPKFNGASYQKMVIMVFSVLLKENGQMR